MIYILDACAMIAYLKGEPGAEVVDGCLTDPTAKCFAHGINLCEVYYDFLRRSDELTAEQVISDLRSAGVIERSDMEWTFLTRVGQLKAHGRISLADCFCIALAQELAGQLLTSDHTEFDPLVSRNLCQIRFIR